MNDWQNLYAVRKTINFEFKPSLYTKKRVLDARIKRNSVLIDVKNNTIEIIHLFNTQNQEVANLVQRYLQKLTSDFDILVEKFKNITDGIYINGRYENFRIYVETSKLKLVGKDFRDCYFQMKNERGKSRKGWDYYYQFNAKTNKAEFRHVKFGDFLTVSHLFAFHYDKTTKDGEFQRLLKEKINFFIKKYKCIQIELSDFLDDNNRFEKFISKPEILDRLKRLAYCIGDILSLMNIFCDKGKNGSDGCSVFIKDLGDFRIIALDNDYESVVAEIIRQVNCITNPKAFHFKFTLNFKAKNPNTQLSGNDVFFNEKDLQKKLKEEMDKLENNKKEKSECQSFLSKFDNLAGKDCTDGRWADIKNKQGLPDNYQDAKKEYESCEGKKKELSKEIAYNENEKNNYAVINQLKAAISNSKNTHFGVVIEKEANYYLALENKISNGKLKADNKYVLNNLKNNLFSCKLLKYESLTWKAVEKLCLLPTSSLNGTSKDVVGYWSKFCKGVIILEKKNEKDKRDVFDLGIIKNYLVEIMSKTNISSGFNKEDFDKLVTLDGIKAYFDDYCFENQWIDADWDEFLGLDREGSIDLYQIFNKDFELDEHFAISENDKERIKRIKFAQLILKERFVAKQKNSERIRNLFTIYWQNCFNKFDTEKFRVQPEGRIYIRDMSPVNDAKRYREEKVLGDFGILFNPVAKAIDQSSKDVKDRIGNFNDYLKKQPLKNEIYVVGLDRGENSLVSYTLVKFRKKIVGENDISVRFDSLIGTEAWVLDEMVEVRDLSAVKIFNEKGKWRKSEFVEQKEDYYFVEKNEGNYDEDKNKQDACKKRDELKKMYPDYGDGRERVVVCPIRCKPQTKKEKQQVEMEKTGAYAVKILSWEDEDGAVYNYRVAQEILKEERLSQVEKNRDFELFNTEKFKNGYVSALIGFIGERVETNNAYVSLENLNMGDKTGKGGNYRKTFGASVYQMIENRLMSKLGYSVVKGSSSVHSQKVPKIRKVEELKKDVLSGEKNNKDFQIGVIQITDETNTSQICPNCGYSMNRYGLAKIENGELKLTLNAEELKDKDFGIDISKVTIFRVDDGVFAWRYSGVATEKLDKSHNDFCRVLSKTRQNETKSKDFIRCVHCGFDSRFPTKNHEKLKKVNGGDVLAAYNIAKRGLEFIQCKSEVIN